MPSTTIKVPIELRDRLAALARERRVSMARVREESLDASDEALFWRRVAETMPPVGAAAESPLVEAALKDGLDPEETWSDVL
jgi:hypothetical protein